MIRPPIRLPIDRPGLVLWTVLLSILLSILWGFVGAPDASAEDQGEPPVDPAFFQALEWRNIGPWRGGRVTAVTGVAGEPMTYYLGSAGGGLWGSRDGGTTWDSLGEGSFGTSSVGAVAVAPSDSNVIYVGMGEAQIRGVTTSHGDGVYRSTDGGATWSHLGLERTRQISRIRVHPEDPDLVYLSAQGNPWRSNAERGVYRTIDGGRSWLRILEVDAETGTSDLALDASNPRVLYAAFWQHRRRPWKVESGGPGSGLYKTTDGGDSWQKLEKGLPADLGKVAVAVSPSRPQRVWALVEAEDGGLFRSDDGGATFRHVNRERLLRARSWYYTKVFADPVDADTVYVLNAPMLRSIDGGRTFERVRTPHGDNHDLWIAPEDPRRMINGNDGGANVSFNGGTTWSTQANQPTAQFYRVITDNGFPYRIYGGQQDNSTVAILSRGSGGVIDRDDWRPVGGCESAHVAFDPDAPSLVYAGCYQGLISEYEVATGRQRNIMTVPVLGLGADPVDLPYRFNWNAPIVVSPHDSQTLYHAANVVLRSRDRGNSWQAVSPDLTRDEPGKQGPGGGPITNEAAGAETYNTILSLVESPHRPGELWAGSDDGLVHVRRGEDSEWEEVTPLSLGEAMVNTLEISPHDPDRVYLAVTAYKLGDFSPYLYRSLDGGASWELRTSGLPDDSFVRVVREDPARPGLLYAGTETGLHVSFDDGERWQPFQLDLPVVAVTDMRRHEDDLVISTQGRGFWVLDDLSPLHHLGLHHLGLDDGPTVAEEKAETEEATETVADSEARPIPEGFRFYPPRSAHRLIAGGRRSDSAVGGENPPDGAVLYYHLDAELVERLEAADRGEPSEEEGEPVAEVVAAGDALAVAGEPADQDASPVAETSPPSAHLWLEILDADGEVVRRFSSETIEHDPIDPPADPTAFGFSKPTPLPAKVGLNRFVWDLRGEEVARVDELFVYGSSKRYRVVPGSFTVRLSFGGESHEQGLEVLADPRLVETYAAAAEADDSTNGRAERLLADYAEQQQRVRALWARVDSIHANVARLRRVRRQVEAAIERSATHQAGEAVRQAGEALVDKLEAWEEPLVQARQETFQDVINFPNRLNAQLLFLLDAIDRSDPPLTEGARRRHEVLEAEWAEHETALGRLLALDIPAFNNLVAESQVPAVVVPPAGGGG